MTIMDISNSISGVSSDMVTPSLPLLYFSPNGTANDDNSSGTTTTTTTTTNYNNNDNTIGDNQENEPASPSTLSTLPPELLHRCLTQFSDWGDLAKLACVQKSWKNLVKDAAEFGGREAMWELSMCLLGGDADGIDGIGGGRAEDGVGDGNKESGSAGNADSVKDSNEGEEAKKESCTKENGIKSNRGLVKNEALAIKYLTRISGVDVDESMASYSNNSNENDTSTMSILPEDWNNTNSPSNNTADEAALLQLAQIHLHSPTTPPNPTLALHYLRLAYHLTHSVQSAHTLALLFEYPQHSKHTIPIDIHAAFEWFKAAAEGGHVPSMAELALCYELGCGVAQSDTDALDWYMKAAEAGHGAAHYSVGEAFEEARGVPMDEEEACLWYYRAAVLGEEDGRVGLRRLEHVARGMVERRVVPEGALEVGGILHG